MSPRDRLLEAGEAYAATQTPETIAALNAAAAAWREDRS